MDANSRLRVVVLGYVVGCPLGGMTWHTVQYGLGLAALGHDVWMLEDANDWDNCYNPLSGEVSTDPTYGLDYAGKVYERLGFDDRWAYYETVADVWHGPAAERALEVCASADVVLNVASMHPVRPWFASIPHRVQIDTDPAFTQIRNLTEPGFGDLAHAHTAHFSFGERIAGGDTTVPDDGHRWLPTRQPVALDHWPATPGDPGGRFSTVMQWDSYAIRRYGGVTYGMKSASFHPYVDLPQATDAPLELALGKFTPAAGQRLRAAGWRLVDPQEVTWDPWGYQDYVRSSAAEFSVAKHGYVYSRCGWFSERSACYLASGRPVVVQDTGFSDVLPTGEGLLAFTSPEEAAEAIARVRADYAHHARAARRVAEECFDARRVLADLLERAVAG